MSGLYSPINRLAESITRPKGTGAEYMNELQKKPGYKPAEAEDRDLQTLMALPQMERAAFMEKLKAQANKFPLKHRELTGTQTHHEQYTLPGGENYREILLHTPMPEGQGFEGRSHHFGGMPNVLASIRVKDRTSPEGKKILHLEEIQSDWHQQGREAGYQPKDLDKQIKEAFKDKSHLTYALRHSGHGMDQYEYAETEKALEEADNELNRLDQLKEEGVPYGPHAKDWHELALKAMIQHAAENGYDQIAVTPGAEQAKRFSLSKQVGSVSYNPETRHFQAFKPNRETITNEKGATPERIQALIGKEAAAKLLQAPKTMGHHYLEGENLDIGGEGMKGFYDKMVPTFLNKFGKKHGVQVGKGAVNATDNLKYNITHVQRAMNIPQDQWDTIPLATKKRMLQEHIAQQPPDMAPVHTFDITPSMREDVVKSGIPRYEDGGIIHKAEGGSMNIPSIEQMKALLMRKNSPVGLGVLQSVGVNEAPNLAVKAFLPPKGQDDLSGIPVGGVDLNPMQPGSQLMQPPQQPQGQPPQGAPQPQAGGMPPQGQPAPANGSNILQMTPQGQAMAAMRPDQPQAMADGGGVSGSGGLQVNIPLTIGSGGGGQPGGLGGLGEMPKMGQFPQPSALGDMAGGTDASPLLPQPLTKQADSQANSPDMLQQMMNAFKNAQQSTPQAPDVNASAGPNPLAGITGMATGGKVQGYASKGYVKHEPQKPHPEVGKRFEITPQGKLAQRQKFNIEDYEGKGSIVPIPYDATSRDNLVTGVSGHKLQQGLLTEGGNDYSLDAEHMAQNIGGASNLGIAGRVQKRVDQAAKEHEGDVLLMPNTMSEDAENFSHHPTTIVLDLMQQRKLNKKTLKALSDDLRQQYEINPTTRAKEYPYKKFVGYDHPELGNQIRYGGRGLETTAGNLRKKMMERLGQVNVQKLLDYNLGDLKAAILDPDVATDPKAYMGHTVVKAQAGAPLRLSKHSSYDTDYTGKNIGGMGNRPLEIMMPDVYSEIDQELQQRPKKVEKTTAQKRAQVVGALEKRKERFAQPINSRVINNAGLYEEGLKNGEFDPKNVESVLAYFKRKGGFKKGGKVKLHQDQDTMMLELSRKKKAK